jgi:O-antigen biosynthesis protein
MSLAGHLRALAQALARPRQPRPPDSPASIRYVYASPGASMRYRVQHQIEAAGLAGLRADAVSLDDPEHLYTLMGADLLVLHRTALGPRSAMLLLLARRWGVRVAFDADDLVWDAQQRQYEFLDRHYAPQEVEQILRTARRTEQLMRRVDAMILATPFLAQRAQSTRRPTHVLMNAVSSEMVALAAKVAAPASAPEIVRIGYFSGHPRVHDEDLATLGAALAHLLQQSPQVQLTLCGEVALPIELERFRDRVERRAPVDWRQLPYEIARVQINIAPLVDNPQRRSKSAVKYLEAALVGVPTVAARMEPYTSVAREGQTALMASTSAEWIAALSWLVTNTGLRSQLGAAARAHVLAEHTTAARAPQLAAMVRSILGAA